MLLIAAYLQVMQWMTKRYRVVNLYACFVVGLSECRDFPVPVSFRIGN